ncbi:hypothetical protein ACMGDH_11905 [Sphingomonas sp. DT-207]|uniref:hypothetical protein n=1 Tax=Sphingomonas sp. DT-207 TaxID=3396167 RepID=UPI003F1B7761
MKAHDNLADVGIALGGGAQVCGYGDTTFLIDRLERKSLEELPIRHKTRPQKARHAFPVSEITAPAASGTLFSQEKGRAPLARLFNHKNERETTGELGIEREIPPLGATFAQYSRLSLYLFFF